MLRVMEDEANARSAYASIGSSITGDMKAREFAYYLDLQKGSMLEIGCHHGQEGFLLSYAFPEMDFIGIDIDRNAIDMAKGHTSRNLDFYLADAHSLPFSDKTFDYVGLIHTFHHLKQHAIDEILRVTKDDGKIYIQDLVRDVSQETLERIRHIEGGLLYDSVRAALSREEYNALAEKIGDDMREWNFKETIPPTINWVIRKKDNWELHDFYWRRKHNDKQYKIFRAANPYEL